MENNYFKMIFEDLKKLWNNLDVSQKFGIVTLSAITIIAATYFFMKATEPNWTVLYSGLTEQDSIAVTESLKKSGYAYKLSTDKGSILVPAHQQEELRVHVAENDLIQDKNPGFELLDTLPLGTTDFKNKLTKQRIFQDEITRSIEKINGIRKARVQLAEPEKSVFSDNDDSPSASVVLILEPGYKLKANQIKAIKNLVAYGMPRLEPEKVFLTDQYGNTLSDDPAKNSGDMESYKLNIENETARKIQTVLEKIVGKQNVNVQVSADIDFNTARATIESYLPANGDNNTGVLAQQQSESEVYEKPQVLNGTEENDLQVPDNERNPKNLNYQKQRSTTNYNVSKEVKQIIYAPGSIKRLTIAVAVNKILTDDESAQLKELIQTAGGADLNRGDIINITSMEFGSLSEGKDAQEELMEQMSQQSNIEFWVTKVAPLGVVLILGLVALFMLKGLFNKLSAHSNASQVWEDDENVAMTIKDELSDMLSVDALPQIEPQLDPELEKMKTSLNETILADPSEATRILISYIKD